jgi:SAM-dependent methyltransferase
MSAGSAERLKHYGTFGLRRVAQQLLGLRRFRAGVPDNVAVRIERLRRDQTRIEEALGHAAQGQRVLIVGPGQLLREARFFAIQNQVTCLDLDVIPAGIDPVAYLKMLRANGPGRVVKTLGRKLLGNDRIELAEWRRQLGVSYLPEPECLVQDICDGAPSAGNWDVLASFAVFQHIPDVRLAVRRCVEALAPGGVLYIGVQLWTGNIGHHDIRAYTGNEDQLPLWGHLRPSRAHEVEPSAWLNELRLRDWRAAFGELCPGFTEYQERFGEPELRAKMTPELREELADYDDEELYTIDVFYRWQKPKAA